MAIYTGDGGDNLFTGTGSDDDQASGLGGNDTLDGGGGNDTLDGGDDQDILIGGSGADLVIGGSGADSLFSGSASTGQSDDAGAVVDTLQGDDGDDWLFAGHGDHADGGIGTDRLWINLLGASGGVTADFQELVTAGTTTVGGAILAGIEIVEHVQGSGFDDHITSTGTVLGNAGNDTIHLYEGGHAEGGTGNDHILTGGTTAVVSGDAGNDTIDGSDATDSADGGDDDDTIDGGAEDDELLGGAGNDTLFGGGDRDLLEGGAGDDVIHGDMGTRGAASIAGGGADDDLYGDEGDDILYGDEGWDLLDGGEGFDQLFGGAGDDMLIASYGDSVDGGTGYDGLVLSFFDAPAGVIADLRTLAPVTVGGATIQRIEGLLSLEGSDFDDMLGAPSSIVGLVVDGGLGNDTLVAGPGATFIDLYLGGEGDDTIDLRDATTGPEAYGDLGDDHLMGSANADTLTGNEGDDFIEGGAGDDDICGCEDDDVIHAGSGSDLIAGDEGDDLVFMGGEFSDDHVSGGDGLADRLVLQGHYPGLTIGADPLGSNSMEGFELLWLLSHQNLAYGNQGPTPFQYVLTLADGVVAAWEILSVDGTELLATESLSFDGSAETDAAFDLAGGAGADHLRGGAQDDRLTGGGGADVLNGGAGFDMVYYEASGSTGVTVAFFQPALNTGSAAGDTFIDVEGMSLTTMADLGYGSNGNDSLQGGDGNDRLYGQGGTDIVDGQDGNDLLWGGLGADHLQGGSGFDYARYDDATFPGMTVALFSPGLNTGAAAGDTYAGIEGLILGFFDDTGYGSNSDDYVYGINGNDRLYGQGGADNVFGGIGDDLLWGGLGADFLDGGDGFDYARYDDATFPGLVASLANPALNTGAAAGDTYANLEGLILGFFDDTGHGSEGADYVYGINGNDTLHGRGGGDHLYGGAGDDVVNGGLGSDLLSGDLGVDTFRFDAAPSSSNVDTVIDFTPGSDKLSLSTTVFSAIGLTLDAGEFRSGAGFTSAADADDFLIYDTTTGALYYDADGVGAGGAVHFLTLTGSPPLLATDVLMG